MRKFIAMLLALTLMLGVLPLTAFAEAGEWYSDECLENEVQPDLYDDDSAPDMLFGLYSQPITREEYLLPRMHRSTSTTMRAMRRPAPER